MEDVQDADQNEEVKEETRQKRAPRTRKQSRKSSAKSGWGDDKNSRKARVQRASDSIQEDGPEAQVPSTNIRTVGDSKEEIAEIPDLQDSNEDMIDTEVAAPPRVMTIRELERELDQASTKTVQGIDLSILYTALSAPEQCQEEDIYWDPDVIFTQAKEILAVAESWDSVEVKPEGIQNAPVAGDGSRIRAGF